MDENTKKLNDIAERVVRIETMLEQEIQRKDSINHRLDSHSHRLDELEKVKNQAFGASLTTKWFIGTALSSIAAACAVAKVVAR